MPVDSTERSRGVALTHGSFAGEVESNAAHFGFVTPADRLRRASSHAGAALRLVGDVEFCGCGSGMELLRSGRALMRLMRRPGGASYGVCFACAPFVATSRARYEAMTLLISRRPLRRGTAGALLIDWNAQK
jgi:hypothetical protein